MPVTPASMALWTPRLGAGAICALLPALAAVVMLGTAALAEPAATTAPGTTKSTKAAAKPAATAAPSADAALRQRVEALEEQFVDLQVVVGTLDSFAKSNGAIPRSGTAEVATGGNDQARLNSLEQQVRALTAQVQQLSDQIRAQGGIHRSEASVSMAPAMPAASPASAPTPKPDTIEGVIAASNAAGGWSAETAAAEPAPAAAPAASADTGNPKQLYETAYGYLLQQDYGAAQTAFDEFLKRYPNDNLAGNAQFWLGESYFVRGQFKPAASAFLKGYTTYGQSAKAPDSLLKLAMSLNRMGQKDAACSSFNELNTRFPTASIDVKGRAAAERQRAGCPG